MATVWLRLSLSITRATLSSPPVISPHLLPCGHTYSGGGHHPHHQHQHASRPRWADGPHRCALTIPSQRGTSSTASTHAQLFVSPRPLLAHVTARFALSPTTRPSALGRRNVFRDPDARQHPRHGQAARAAAARTAARVGGGRRGGGRGCRLQRAHWRHPLLLRGGSLIAWSYKTPTLTLTTNPTPTATLARTRTSTPSPSPDTHQVSFSRSSHPHDPNPNLNPYPNLIQVCSSCSSNPKTRSLTLTLTLTRTSPHVAPSPRAIPEPQP